MFTSKRGLPFNRAKIAGQTRIQQAFNANPFYLFSNLPPPNPSPIEFEPRFRAPRSHASDPLFLPPRVNRPACQPTSCPSLNESIHSAIVAKGDAVSSTVFFSSKGKRSTRRREEEDEDDNGSWNILQPPPRAGAPGTGEPVPEPPLEPPLPTLPSYRVRYRSPSQDLHPSGGAPHPARPLRAPLLPPAGPAATKDAASEANSSPRRIVVVASAICATLSSRFLSLPPRVSRKRARALEHLRNQTNKQAGRQAGN